MSHKTELTIDNLWSVFYFKVHNVLKVKKSLKYITRNKAMDYVQTLASSIKKYADVLEDK